MKLFSLLRASMTEGMDIFSMKRGGKGTKIALTAGIFFMFFFYADLMLGSLREHGNETALLSMFVGITALLTFIEGVYKAGSLLFNCRDDDMLLSLPISRKRIVSLRILKFYIFELAYNSLFLLPAILVYLLRVPHSESFIPVSLVILLGLPIIPLALSCVIGALTTAFASRFKKHNLIQTAILFIFMIGVMVLSFRAGLVIENIGEYANEITGVINHYYPARAYTEIVTNFEMIKLLAFVIINIVVATVAILFISKIYFRINSRVKTVSVSVAQKDVELSEKVRRPFFALIKKEVNRFFGTPVFILNAGFGLVLFLLGIGVICFKFDAIGEALTGEDAPFTIESIKSYLPSVVLVILAFCSLMSFMTSMMISLEGKAINLTKTLPVSAKKILLAKVGASLVIVWPPLLLGTIVAIIRFNFGIIESLALILAGIILPMITELFGILIDLKRARFDYESEAEIVKQSTSTMVATFFGLGGSLGAVSISLACVFGLGQQIGLLVADAIFLAIFGAIYLRFAKVCDERFSRLQS